MKLLNYKIKKYISNNHLNIHTDIAMEKFADNKKKLTFHKNI